VEFSSKSLWLRLLRAHAAHDILKPASSEPGLIYVACVVARVHELLEIRWSLQLHNNKMDFKLCNRISKVYNLEESIIQMYLEICLKCPSQEQK
jgi:hypothetical protein